MDQDQISLKTRQAFREYMVGWVLREISDEFDAARIECDLQFAPPVPGQRRTLIEQYYHSVDWSDPRQIKRVLEVFGGVLHRLSNPPPLMVEEFYIRSRATLEKLTWLLGKDGFIWNGDRIVRSSGEPFLDELKRAVAPFDAAHLAAQIRRMQDSVEDDPTLAIGTAKELIETTCKTILDARGMTVTGNPDIPTLTKSALKELKLVPEGIAEGVRGAEIVKRLLSNLGTIGNNLGELRGLYGTGHGNHGSASGLETRHARLAVGAAATLCTFLFDTHSAQSGNSR